MLLDWPHQGRAFDVAVHLGSLLAVLHCFRGEVRELAVAWCRSFAGFSNRTSRLAWMLFIATLPAACAGLLFDERLEDLRGSAPVIAGTTILFGLLLWWADRAGSGNVGMTALRWPGALAVGLAQACALVPGVSRSGVTLSAALALGLTRTEAARFSFLLAIPVIAGAGIFESRGLFAAAEPVPWREMLLGIVLSGLTARLCIGAFLRFVARIGMAPFALYRIVLGTLLLSLA